MRLKTTQGSGQLNFSKNTHTSPQRQQGNHVFPLAGAAGLYKWFLARLKNSRPLMQGCPQLTKAVRGLLVAVLLVSTSGASCNSWRGLTRLGNPLPQAPRVLPEQPTLAQVIGVVNANTSRVQALSSSSARINVPGTPALTANLALQRPRRFRMRAQTTLTGHELDLGSNDQEFWFWIRRSQPPALYHCRHDQFDMSAARQVVPLDPQWLIEALGLVTLDPVGQHVGPQILPGGQLEVRSRIPAATGDLTRVMVIDGARGWVLAQHLYDARGTLLASAVAMNHQYIPLHGVSLPRRVDVSMPAAELTLSLELPDLQVNSVVGDPQQLWTRPQYGGYPNVDLATMGLDGSRNGGLPPGAGRLPGQANLQRLPVR